MLTQDIDDMEHFAVAAIVVELDMAQELYWDTQDTLAGEVSGPEYTCSEVADVVEADNLVVGIDVHCHASHEEAAGMADSEDKGTDYNVALAIHALDLTVSSSLH